ncbi:MAG: hypothetical protein AB1757_01875 [Acidobacteriota bacterium]
MKKAYIITEGSFDAELLKKLLPKNKTRDIEFVVGSGRYSAQSLARTLLANRQIPVALVLDADTTNEKNIQEQKDFLEELLRQAASDTKFEVFLVEPEMEALLVETPSIIEKLTKKHFSKMELRLAKLHPRKFLADALEESNQTGGKRLQLVKDLDEQAIKALRRHPLVTSLNSFLSSIAA